MAGAQRSGARWVALVLGIALVASAAVAYALVRVTAPSTGGDEAVASTVKSPVASTSPGTVSPADVAVSSPESTTGTSLASTPADTASASGVAPTTDETPTTAPPPVSSTVPPSTTPSAPSTGSAAPSSGPSSSAAISTVTSMLGGSGVTLPAAWSGQATITVTVLGKCATKTPSVYANTPADLALDLPQNEAAAVAPTVTAALPDNEPTLTLGVNANAVPSLAVYSSAVDESGAFHRYWKLRLKPRAHRVQIRGDLVDQATDGDNPNIMVDAETSLQHCETAGTVALPRVFAAGSTLSGWVSRTRAHLTLKAHTTDGKRAVTVVVTATRKQ